MDKRKLLRPVLIFIPLIGLLLMLSVRDEIIAWANTFPKCPFYTMLHIYCPACGNTRSVLALMQGDIVSSLRLNITPVVVGSLAAAGYVELCTYAFGKHKKILPRSNIFLFSVVVVMILYYVLRNFFI